MKNSYSKTWFVCVGATVTCIHLIWLLLSSLAQFQPALPGYRYQFPRDYFNHPDYQTEWWYYTGNLCSADGHRLGFELTFFRQGVTRNLHESSTWDVRDLYLAHFAISDLDGKKFFHIERTNRAGPGIAGASESARKVWNGNWSVVRTEDAELLTATADTFALNLNLKSEKPPVIHGENGVSQKSPGPGRASHYFSETRLAAAGDITVNSRSYSVTGLAWMDHEFFTNQLDEKQVGWDWLSLQFDDNTELMLFRIRGKDGSIAPFFSGTLVDAQGYSTHLLAKDFALEPAAEIWTSPSTNARYPTRWRVQLPSRTLSGEITTPLPSQELTSASTLVPSYWEGAVFFKGNKGASKIKGAGYLEMTGYDQPVFARAR